jgi:hypothetical protein
MSEQQEVYPVGYFETLNCLRHPKWETAGMINDVREFVRRDADVPAGQVLAVIDYLREAQSRDLIRELVVACKVGLASLRHGGITGKSPETDTLEAAIQRAEKYI